MFWFGGFRYVYVIVVIIFGFVVFWYVLLFMFKLKNVLIDIRWVVESFKCSVFVWISCRFWFNSYISWGNLFYYN